MSDDLLPCPFCGAAAETDGWDKKDDDGCVIGYGYIIECSNAECPVSPSVSGDAEDCQNLIDAWNTRVAPEKVQ